MTTLYISPDSPALVHAAAAVLLYAHIGAGGVGLLSGAAAYVFRKGSRLHRLGGNVFVVSMLIMSGIGATVAPFLPTPERASVVAGVLTFYLVLSSRAAVKRKPGHAGVFDYGLLLTSLGIVAVSTNFLCLAAQSPNGMLDGQPGAAFWLFLLHKARTAASCSSAGPARRRISNTSGRMTPWRTSGAGLNTGPSTSRRSARSSG